MSADSRIAAITARIVERSKPYREPYLARVRSAASKRVTRSVLGCGNLAHGFAVCSPSEKVALSGDEVPNLGIITSYNDMLSAHQPFETYPALIRRRPMKPAAWHRWPVACRPCAMASPRASRAWSCRCFPAI
jgi:phosphogluconate dehydratase